MGLKALFAMLGETRKLQPSFMGGVAAPLPAPARGRSQPESAISLTPMVQAEMHRSPSEQPTLRFGGFTGVIARQPPAQALFGYQDPQPVRDGTPFKHGSLARAELVRERDEELVQ